MDKKLEKSAVQTLIRQKSERVTYEKNDGTSDVWKQFVKVKVDGDVVPFVKCATCNTALKWKSRDGTSGLKVSSEFYMQRPDYIFVSPLPKTGIV